ncbi:MAG: TIGR02452 family protein [Clostridiales bacterium]|nr:TIGR02452 family protein [Clostridiales bacterium]
MADRYERIRIFEQTMEICRNAPDLQASIRESIEKQKIIWEEDPVAVTAERRDIPAELVITPERTLGAAQKYQGLGKRICALNFASSVTPGGGVARGAGAQEESLCRISTLYAAISDRETAGPFYDRHWQMIRSGEMNRKNRDDCIFTPGVAVIREDTFDCDLLPADERYSVDVITCAAPDLRYDNNGSVYQPGEAELTAVFEKRWRRILTVAANYQADILILGAFGCGAFYNPPEVVVRAFSNIFDEFAHFYETVEFAVFAQNKYDQNYQVFSGMKGIRKQ